MKRLMILSALALALSSNVFANDGGVAYIDVDSINPAGLESDMAIEIVGGDAHKLFDLLPATTSAIPGLGAKTHTLALVSDGHNLFISCSRDAGQMVCTITAEKVLSKEFKYDFLGDAFEFNKKQVCKK